MARHAHFWFALLAALVPASSLPAQSQAPGANLAQERAALVRATAQAAEAQRRSAMLEQRALLASAAADRTRDQAAALAARVQQSEANIRAGQARIAIISAQQRVQTRRLALRQKPIVRLTAALQQIARRSPVLALVEPGPVGDAVHRRIILSQMMPIVAARTRDLRAEISRSAALRRTQEQANAALAGTRTDLLDQRKTLAALEQRLRVAARQLRETAGAETERALAMGEEARDIGDLLGQIEAAGSVRDSLLNLPGPTLRPANPGAAQIPVAIATPAVAIGAPSYRLPVIGDVVRGFGEMEATGLRTRGLTMATMASATVTAPANGRVAFAGPFRGYGQILIIEHGGGWTSLIANLGTLSAAVGDEVRQGDPVGSAPATGRPQLTIELRKGEEPVDIVSVLR